VSETTYEEYIEPEFVEALTVLGIQDRAKKIWCCHPRGELHFVYDYIVAAKVLRDDPVRLARFKWQFEELEQHPEQYGFVGEEIYLYMVQILLR
jgi:hypothetical protein